MHKERLLSLMGDMEGPDTFKEHSELLQARVLTFPDTVSVPVDPTSIYGQGWNERFALPQSPVGVEDAQSLIILKDTKAGATGLQAERLFLFVQPLPRPMFPVDFYLAWGTCWITFTIMPLRMNAGIAKKGEWFVGEEGSEFTDGVQMAMTMQKCESMIPPGVTTAFEQLAYLNHIARNRMDTDGK
jgi:hypothetical protein